MTSCHYVDIIPLNVEQEIHSRLTFNPTKKELSLLILLCISILFQVIKINFDKID